MKVEFSATSAKEFLKLDRQIQRQIKKFIENLEQLDNPRIKGKQLTGNMSDLWRYRVGDYRLICNIQDDKLIILVLRLGHRKNIYN